VSDPIATVLKTGRRSSASGNPEYARCDESIAQAMFQAHGKYHDAVLRGRCYAGGTAATGVAPGTAIGTTAAFSLYNPIGSGVNLHVLRATMGYISGTLGAGVVHWLANLNPAAAVTTGTAITAVNCLLGGAAANGRPLTTATIPAPTILRPFVSLQASLASTAVQPWQVMEDVDSEFVVTPGCTISLHATAAAGTSPVVVFGVTWEEFAISV
jgi:hypothetical protein